MQSYDKFSKKINAILNSNLLSSGNVIRNFLIFLANDETCREILHAANETVNLKAEYDKVFNEKLGLPKSPQKIVAVITGTLYFLDTAQVTVTSLLNALYKDKTKEAAYSLFLNDIIRPYADSFLKLIKGEPMEEFSVPKQSIFDKMSEDVKSVVREMKESLPKLKISQNGAAVIGETLDGLIYSLQYGDPVLTRYSFGGFLNALQLFGIKAGFEDDLTKILKLYGVL